MEEEGWRGDDQELREEEEIEFENKTRSIR